MPEKTRNTLSVQFKNAEPHDVGLIARFIYESSHELMNFIFGDRTAAELMLAKLIRRPNGHFSHRFATVMVVDNEIVGGELGYSREQLAAQEVIGAINMFRALPLAQWPRLVGRVSPALSGYVPLPSERAYYINNIAIDSSMRGKGLGESLLAQVVQRARLNGYRCIELDVTEINEPAIRFYRRYGFRKVSESGTEKLTQTRGLPRLLRMRRVLEEVKRFGFDKYGRPTNTTVVNNISKLNPVQVDDVFVPGSIEQLQALIKQTEKPISIGGGRFSMGGQIGAPGSLHIDMRGLNRVLGFNEDLQTIRVQSGARWTDIQRVIDDYGLSVSIMQTYSSFTVGGSLSVNCHGRYIGAGPLVLSVRSISILLHDGEIIDASPEKNSEFFYAAIGGYGALGIIVEAELYLAKNVRIERRSHKLSLNNYLDYFHKEVRQDRSAIFHNADMVPPNFRKVRSITWSTTDKPANTKSKFNRFNLYLAEKYMLWAITETPFGHIRREYLYEPLLYLWPKISYRNEEADYDVAELEPLSRERTTYVLQEYFVPVEKISDFVEPMTEILNRHKVQVVNISIRHAIADPGTLLAWANKEVFAMVLYYKQGTSEADSEAVAIWTRELIDAVLDCHGSFYLPYQIHARVDQFHRAYPSARKFFALKERLDPNYRFRNLLLGKYYRVERDQPLATKAKDEKSEFSNVYRDVRSRDDFFRFLQVIFHLYPETKFHKLIIDACQHLDSDEAIYNHLIDKLPTIKTRLSELTFALPALKKQKKEIVRQTKEILPSSMQINGYLEIGSTGRYVKGLKNTLSMNGMIYLMNDTVPDYSIPDIMERGRLARLGKFCPLNNYEPIPEELIPIESLSLVSCFIGLHHCPREKLDAYIQSIYRVLRPGGFFVLRDHDAGTANMRTFCSLVHTVFNAGVGLSWELNCSELRLFEGVDFWVDTIVEKGFKDTGKRILQQNDPSLNTLLCFQKESEPSPSN